MQDSRDPIEGVFAEFAGRFGLSRPAGQCFAAIWRSAEAPCADDLVRQVGISRSNVSTALKELRHWGLVGVLRAPGDRKEYFTAPADPWALLGTLMAERARRDIAPARDRLEAMADDPRAADLAEMMGALADWMEGLGNLDPSALRAAIGGEEAADAGGARKKKDKKKKKKG